MNVNVKGKTYTIQRVGSVAHEVNIPDDVKWVTFDTETTGLHIKKDKAFQAAIAYHHNEQGKVFLFEPTEINLKAMLFKLQKHTVYGHNIVYDMHMIANVIGEDSVMNHKWGDTMGLARLSFEAISIRDGGDSLALKQIAKKYIDHNADKWEKEVKSWLSAKARQDAKLAKAMKTDPPPLPTYADVPDEIMSPYLAMDVIFTDILASMATPVVKHKKQYEIAEKEFALLHVVFKMERQGIKVDRQYLLDSRDRLDTEIQRLTELMHSVAGQEFSVGQHKVIKEIYGKLLGEIPKSTDKAFLKKQAEKGDEMAKAISSLRRLEKWRETYIERILQASEYDGRFYTSMNQFNPVSGRFSGDAQQFPKDSIYGTDGKVIYEPRKAFLLRGYFLDFSQVELRVQSHYTLPFGGDVNLCRAYMPYNCTHFETGEVYQYDTKENRDRWSELKEGAPTGIHWEEQLKSGWSVWVNPDTSAPWIPTDVHSATADKALAIMGMDKESLSEKEKKYWRSVGKMFNFMRNYGGGDKKASEALDISIESAQAMNRGYTEAFPVVVRYQNEVINAMRKRGYVANLSGRRYYIKNSDRYYKCANYIIQGTCADDLKEKMIKIDALLTNSNTQVKMVLCVHDEIIFSSPRPEDDWVFADIKAIMEHTPKIKVPIVAEVDFTETDWATKKKVLL